MDSLILSKGGSWNAAAARYWPLQCGPGQTASTSNANAESVMPCDGSLTKLLGAAPTALAGGTSVTLTVMKNTVATALEVVLDSTNQILRDTTNTVTFVKGDRIAIRSTPSGSPTGQQPVFGLQITAADGQPLITGEGSAISATATAYFGLQGSTVSVDADVATVVPTAGTISKLQLRLGAAAGASKDWTVVLVKNGVDQTLTATIGGASDTTAEDATHSVSVAEGDTVYWRATPTGTPANAVLRIAAVFAPTTSGESIYTSSLTGSVLVSSGNRFTAGACGGDGNAWNSTESAVLINVPADGYTATKLRTVLQVAPTPGTRTITLRKNAAATALTFNISGASTTGSDTDAGISYSATDTIAIQTATASSPPTSIATISFVLFKATATTVAVGQATTTNTAQAITSRKTMPVGQATTTNTAQAITFGGARAVGQATSTNTAQAITAHKTTAVGRASSTNTSRPVTRDLLATATRIRVTPALGQSNMRGLGSSSTAPNVPAGDGYMWDGSAFVPLDEPVHGLFEPSNTGSCLPAYCNAFVAADISGAVPAIVQAAIGGTSQCADADTGNGTWDVTGTLFDDALAEIEAALAAVAAAYPLATIELREILWSQGEKDAQQLDAADIIKADYKDALEAMIARWRTELGADLRFYISQTGHDEAGDTTGFQQIRDAQQEVADAHPLTFIAFAGAQDFPETGKANGLHYTQTGYDEMGAALGAFVARNPVDLTEAIETDVARAITAAKTAPVGRALETDAARTVTMPTRVAQATETDVARAITAVKTVPVAQVVESESAQSVAVGGVAGRVVETSQALAITSAKRLSLSLATETDTAGAISAVRSWPLARATTVDTAGAISIRRTYTIGQAAEADTARVLTLVDPVAAAAGPLEIDVTAAPELSVTALVD